MHFKYLQPYIVLKNSKRKLHNTKVLPLYVKENTKFQCMVVNYQNNFDSFNVLQKSLNTSVNLLNPI